MESFLGIECLYPRRLMILGTVVLSIPLSASLGLAQSNARTGEPQSTEQAVDDGVERSPSSLPLPRHTDRLPEKEDATKPKASQPHRESRTPVFTQSRTNGSLPVPGRPSRNLPRWVNQKKQNKAANQKGTPNHPNNPGSSKGFHISFETAESTSSTSTREKRSLKPRVGSPPSTRPIIEATSTWLERSIRQRWDGGTTVGYLSTVKI